MKTYLVQSITDICELFSLVKTYLFYLTNDNILVWSELEACADDKLNETEKFETLVCSRKVKKQTLREKEKMLFTSIFSCPFFFFFFKKASVFLKTRDCLVKVKSPFARPSLM